MKLGLTVVGIAARLARWRIARTREQAIRSALRSISEQRQQQAMRKDDQGPAPSSASGPRQKRED